MSTRKLGLVVPMFAVFALTLLAIGQLATVGAATPPSPAGYHLLKTISLGAAPGGEEYFDYLTFDSGSRRLYLSHGTEVKVVNADTGSVVGTITGLKRCHGIALVNDLGKGFITDGVAGTVVVFDLATLKITAQLEAAPDADSILYDSASKRIFSFNGASKTSTAIDPAKVVVVGTIQLGGTPEQGVADGKGAIYINIADTNEVLAIDAQTLKIRSRWPVSPSGQPVSMAMDRVHRRLFIGGWTPTLFEIMNADSGKVIGKPFPIGDRVDATIYDPGTNLVISSTREGTLHVLHEDSPDTFSLVETVKTEFGAKTMAFDPKTTNAYLITSDFEMPVAPNGKEPQRRPRAIPGTFRLLIYGRGPDSE